MLADAERVERRRIALARWADVPAADVRLVVSPYRVCPLGAHVDHQHGPVLGMAIDRGTLLAFVPAPGAAVHLESADFPGEVRFDLAEASGGERGWARYARAAAAVLGDRLPSRPRGIRGSVEGDLPGGGLSSSASVLVAYLLALAAANGLELSPEDLVALARRAENEFVGVQSGILDPASVVAARRGRLLEIDTRETRWRAIALGAGARDVRVLVVFCGRGRSLSSTPFNARVAECRSAAARIAHRAGLAPVHALGDLPETLLEERLETLPRAERGRARHFLEERRRVRRGAAAWQRGDLVEFGRLMSDSCRSSVENYETGSREQLELQRILTGTPGVLGARFSGAGYGGCNVALVDAEHAGAVRERLLGEYRQAFPEHAARVRVFVVESADGARLL